MPTMKYDFFWDFSMTPEQDTGKLFFNKYNYIFQEASINIIKIEISLKNFKCCLY